MGSSIKVVSLGVIAGIVIAATLLILFVTGAIDQSALSTGLMKGLAVIGIMMGAFLGVIAVTHLVRSPREDK